MTTDLVPAGRTEQSSQKIQRGPGVQSSPVQSVQIGNQSNLGETLPKIPAQPEISSICRGTPAENSRTVEPDFFVYAVQWQTNN